MPLTSKGEDIKAAMEKTYGAEKGERVFYASKAAGTIAGVDDGMMAKLDAAVDLVRTITRQGARSNARLDAAVDLVGTISRQGRADATAAEAKAKIESSSASALRVALSDQRTDPKVRKMIEKELDYRAEHGQSR